MIEEIVILTQIIFIDIILAADNAIIIGLIAANFVPKNRKQIILWGVAGALISITFTIHPYMGLPYTIRSFMIVIVAGLGNLPGVAMSGMGLGVFEEFADYILGTEFRIGSVFLLLVLILVYRRFKLSRKREYLK